MSFVHLHTHSEYSLLDGANRIPELIDRVKALGMDSLAITDHGNLHGAWAFYAEAKEGEGIRTTSGTYTYQDGILNLKAHDGEVHTYPAKLVDGGRTLKLDGTWEGNKLELRYERDRKEGA